MQAALMIVQFLGAAASAGMNLTGLLSKVSTLIEQRHKEGGTLTREDLEALFDQGDAVEAAARKQFADTLADPNTPKQ